MVVPPPQYEAQRKTDMWRTVVSRPVCFHFEGPDTSFDTAANAKQYSTTIDATILETITFRTNIKITPITTHPFDEDHPVQLEEDY
ncbi:hypothetical protein TNCV_625851 [Trichonephila clavipes]|nr:hypothetical protein TNCV_625851 [Trichonephila clavipes]